MIRFGVDINDTYRALTRQVAINYQKAIINPEWDINNLRYNEEDFWGAFPFEDGMREIFLNEQYSFEVYGSAKTMDPSLAGKWNIWHNNLNEYDQEDDFIVKFICPDENYLCIQSTYFFLSKSACRVRSVEFPISVENLWQSNDIVVSANPKILNATPKDKVAIKIKTPYNNNAYYDYVYDSLLDFIDDKRMWMKLLKLKD
jgi:hypothetical protein